MEEGQAHQNRQSTAIACPEEVVRRVWKCEREENDRLLPSECGEASERNGRRGSSFPRCEQAANHEGAEHADQHLRAPASRHQTMMLRRAPKRSTRCRSRFPRRNAAARRSAVDRRDRTTRASMATTANANPLSCCRTAGTTMNCVRLHRPACRRDRARPSQPASTRVRPRRAMARAGRSPSAMSSRSSRYRCRN